MSKWRSTCPDVLLTRIEQGHEAQLYLLRQTGPTGFLVKEQDSDTKYKVLLGLDHTCDCSVFLKERELCKHIIWIITRKFRIPKDNPLVYQLGLNERELNDVIYGPKQRKKVVNKTVSAGNERVTEKKKEIDSDDVCPICQEEIYNTKKTLVHCKFGCGNSIHINCMKIWADHQLKALNEDIIKCPLCRTEFSSHQNIIKEYSRAKAKEKAKLRRLSPCCKKCNTKLSLGQYYRCSVCKDLPLCHTCFQTNYHNEHPFEYRRDVQDKWSPVDRLGISLAPNVSRYDANYCISPVEQVGNISKKTMDRIRSKQTRSANACSLPDLSLGVSGINIHTPINDNARSRQNSRLPPLSLNRTQANFASPNLHGKVRSNKYALTREHTLPKEGISDIISVLSLR